MKYAQFDDNGQICARYDSDIHGDTIPADAIELSDDVFWQTINENDGVWKRDPKTGEIAKHLCQPPTDEQLASNARVQRDHLIAATDWMVLRAQETGKPVAAEWLAYRQALRDVPAQKGFPSTVTWPTAPEAT